MMNVRRLLWSGLLVAASSAWAQGPAERVEAARKLVADSKFKEALAELDAIAKLPNNDRATVTALYEVSGLSYAGLKQAPKAKGAFQKVLVLEPAFKLQGKVPPKTAALFRDAKKAVTQAGGGGLAAEQLTPEVKGGKVSAVYVSVEKDPAGLAKRVRMHLQVDGGAWAVKEVPVQAPTVVEAGGKVVRWWLEVLGDNEAVLFVLGSEASPKVDAIPGALPRASAAATPAQEEPKRAEAKKEEPKREEPKKVEAKKDAPKKDAPVAEAKPSLVPTAKAEPEPDLTARASDGKGPKVLPWVLGGAGVASAGVGAAFGAMSMGARGRIANATVSQGTGLVTSIDRAQALDLEKQAQTNAVVANMLFAVGAGLVAGGVVAWFMGGD